jgi:hypothetical protein
MGGFLALSYLEACGIELDVAVNVLTGGKRGQNR